jgi:hypothetical protein
MTPEEVQVRRSETLSDDSRASELYFWRETMKNDSYNYEDDNSKN